VLSPRVEGSFRYDPLDRRTEKRVIRWQDEDGDSTPDPDEEQPPRVIRYLYDGEDILATFTETGRVRARYTHGPGIDEPLAELHRRQVSFYHADVLGSILALTDATGQPLHQYHYRAFGLPEDARADRQPYRFTAREWDKEIGLYYYRARYYDPRVGRFLAEDLLGLSRPGRVYPYVGSNPTTLVDPMGLWQTKRVVRGAIAATTSVVAMTVMVGAVASIPATEGLSTPVAVGLAATAYASSVGFSAGVTEVIRGIVEPADSSAPSIPTPYISTLTITVATGGNLEIANWYNDVTDVAIAARKVLDPEKLASLEWFLAEAKSFDKLRYEPIYLPGLSAPERAPWRKRPCQAR